MNDIIKELVKMADKFDSEGKTELASAVDETILSLAARPKSNKPLKKMDDKVKDELFKFLGCVCNDMDASVKALEELMRRLRYFNVDGEVKGLKLPDMLKEVKEISDKVNSATHKMYEMAFGRKLPKEYLKSLKKEDKKEQDANDPFSFARSDVLTNNNQEADKDKQIKINELMKEYKKDGGMGRSGIEMIEFIAEHMPDLNKNEIHELLMYMGYLPRPKKVEEPTAEEMDEFWDGDKPDSFEDNAEDGVDNA